MQGNASAGLECVGGMVYEFDATVSLKGLWCDAELRMCISDKVNNMAGTSDLWSNANDQQK